MEVLAKKENNYGAETCYMKVVDKDACKKVKFIDMLEDDGIKMPYWITDDKQEIIL